MREVLFYDKTFDAKKQDPNPMVEIDFSEPQLRWVAFRGLNYRVRWPEGENHRNNRGQGNCYSNSIHYTHGSTLRTFEEIFGVTPLLNDAANETDLSDLFATFP